MNAKWKEYLSKFETTVMVEMYRAGCFSGKEEPVSLRPGKLATTTFGVFMQNLFESKEQIALNFYGLTKHSTGLIQANLNIKRPVIKAPVIHFSAVKVEYVERFNQDLLRDFVSFKKYLVSLRW